LKHLFFDLDGTLTDSHDGIVRCINHALKDAGLTERTASDLRPFLGPPLRESFASLLDTTDDIRVERAMRAYRSRFETIGMFENAVYPGIREALDTLSARGFHLHVVTAKPAVYARRILEHFKLDARFESINGPELGSRGYNKVSLIRETLAATGAVAGSTAMIGDRGEDVAGARANSVYAIAVTWGYGGLAELEAEGPHAIVASPGALWTGELF
jgi:phosphoglycolate phosphatase